LRGCAHFRLGQRSGAQGAGAEGEKRRDKAKQETKRGTFEGKMLPSKSMWAKKTGQEQTSTRTPPNSMASQAPGKAGQTRRASDANANAAGSTASRSDGL
jgi:hypothetical protein